MTYNPLAAKSPAPVWGVAVSETPTNHHPALWNRGDTFALSKVLAELGAPPWYDWQHYPSVTLEPYVDRWTPMIFNPGKADLYKNIGAYDGGFLLVGNEPESGLGGIRYKGEGGVERFAMDVVRMASVLAEQGMSLAWCAPNGNVNRPNMPWFEAFSKRMMTVDWLFGLRVPHVWGVHLYGFWDGQTFHRDWYRMSVRDLMAWHSANGYGAPMLITETCAEGAPLYEQMWMMEEIRKLVGRPEFLGAYWFSSQRHWHRGAYWTSELVDDNGQLTPLGAHWKTLAP